MSQVADTGNVTDANGAPGSTGSVGCSTETKTKTDEFGDTKTKKTTEC